MRAVSALPVPDRPLSPSDLAELSDEQVAAEITTWGGRVAAGEARLLAYVGEFDERRAWAVTGILSCAHWLSWKLGTGVKTSSDRVRVARALRSLPLTFAEFTAGRLSFTQVRAITRIATAADEEMFVHIARHASGEQLERLAGGIRRARKITARAAKDAVPQRPKVTTRYDADGDMIITVKASAAEGAVVLAALDAACSDLDSTSAGPAESSAEDSKRPSRATQGQGFLELCEGYLRQRARDHPDRARRDRSKLIVQVDPLSGWARLPDGELLPPAVADTERLTLPAGTAIRRLTSSDLTAHDAGRSRREAPQALRDLLLAVDGHRCRFPTCTRRRRLHAHHLVYWEHEGPTDLANMIMLCGRHHTLVHAEGFQFALDPTTRILTVTTRTGTPIPLRPAAPWQSPAGLDPLGVIAPTTLPPRVLDRLDLHYAVEVLLHQVDRRAMQAAA